MEKEKHIYLGLLDWMCGFVESAFSMSGAEEEALIDTIWAVLLGDLTNLEH
jgi:hypothetical protein